MDTGTVNTEFVLNRMSGIARLIYDVMPTKEIAGFVLLALVFLMSAVVYKLGFAKKLRPLQNAMIYTFLFIGCLILTFLALFLPVVEGLIVAALILIIYRVRRMNEHKEDSVA